MAFSILVSHSFSQESWLEIRILFQVGRNFSLFNDYYYNHHHYYYYRCCCYHFYYYYY